MGFFDKKAICGVCGKECGLNRYKIKRSDGWICPDCLKKAGGVMNVDVSKVTIQEIRQIISDKNNAVDQRRAHSSTGLASARDMFQYSKDNNFGNGMTDSWALKHFKVIEDNLLPDEDVLMTFIGLHNFRSTSKHDNNFAYAITNKRVIMAQKLMVGENLKTVYLDNLNDITFSSGLMFGIVTIDTMKEKFNVGLDKVSAKAICSEAHRILDNLRSSQQPAPISSPSAADEIIKFKQLLDAGILTQEEFDLKKKQLLGL